MREWPRTEGVFIALGGPQAHRSAALTFVISTEAKRSGEISVLTRLPGNVFRPELNPDFLLRSTGQDRVCAFL
jgi:hypothetical protein